MSVKLTKRVASSLLKRGRNSIRIKEDAIETATKAITREDVRDMIKKGEVYAKPKKKVQSLYGKLLSKKRKKGRARGPGRKRGTLKARTGDLYIKKIRAQRRIIKKMKEDKIIDNQVFKKFYALAKGGSFNSKASLLNHMRGDGVKIDDEMYNKLKHV